MAEERAYMDFSSNTEIDEDWNRDKIYKVGLKDQFDRLQIGTDYEFFVRDRMAKPNVPLGISYPNFERTPPSTTEKNRWFNVAVRMPIDGLEYDVVFMCDIDEYTPKNKTVPHRFFKVKGITTLDKGASTCGEIPMVCDVFTRLYNQGEWYNTNFIPNKYLSEDEMRRSVLSIDFLTRLSTQYVVKEPQKVVDRLSRWEKYLAAKKEVMEKDLNISYSIDEAPEVILAYYKSNCSEEEKEKGIPYLKVKDQNGVWSSEDLPGSEKAPLIHIVHDFLEKEYNANPEIRKKYESFTSGRSLLISEELIFEEVKKGKGTEKRPKFRSEIKLTDSRISSKADEEIIPNKSKIDRIVTEGKEAIVKIRKEVDDERARESRILMEQYEKDVIPPIVEDYRKKEYDKHIESCISIRQERIAEDRKKLEVSLANLEGEYGSLTKLIAEDRKKLEALDKSDKAAMGISSALKKNEDKASELEKKIESVKAEIGSLEKKHDLESIVSGVISPFVNSYRSELIEEHRDSVDGELRIKYEQIFKAKEDAQNNQTNERIETVKREETRVRLHVFYRLDVENAGEPESILKNAADLIRGKTLFLYKDPSGDMSILNRQKTALDNLKKGYVMNPFLATALFNSSNQTTRGQANIDHFYSRRLNDKQKEAIRKAVASNGMFLIRGPPGTGKTEVIAEITAQLVVRNKKVLIASENHKAVDNAFLRLPEIPTLRRVRLFGGYARRKEDSNPYSVKNQTANFYLDIAKRLESEIQKSSSSKSYAENLDTLISDLKKRAEHVSELKGQTESILKRISDTESEIDKITKKVIRDREENTEMEFKIAELKDVIDSIQNLDWENAGAYVSEISVPYGNGHLSQETIRGLYALSKPDIKREYQFIDKHRGFFDMYREKAEASNDTDAKAIELRMLEYQKDNGFSAFDFKVVRLFPLAIPDRDEILGLKGAVDETIDGIIAEIEKQIYEETELCNDTTRDEQRIRELEKDIQSLRSEPTFKNYDDEREKLDSDIRRALSDNNILGVYKSLEEGIGFIEQEIGHIKRAAAEGMSEELQSSYRKMASYLRTDSVIDRDSEKLNEDLLDYANVIGLTCTTSDSIKTDVGTVDLKRANLDVVIVDEVSKVSFLEVLYPILYGKTVILVGDDKQLPPIYQSNVLDGDYDRYNPELVSKTLEDEYRHLYETSFFKELYEAMPECNRTMLTVQYRMHPDIMDADNIFYGNQLSFDGDIGSKEHYLEIKGGLNRNIVSKNSHLIFIDVDGKEERGYSGGRSRINQREANVITNLLRKMEYSCTKDGTGEELGGRKFTKEDDPRLSLGVICGYSDQAKLIRRSLKGFKFQSFNRKDDEQFMVDTVDNFQGDERDIIILSLVATNRLENSFMRVYNRINVAISRARRLLIIVGNGRAFSNLRTEIDGRYDYVYRKIVDAAKYHHGYTTERDVLGE